MRAKAFLFRGLAALIALCLCFAVFSLAACDGGDGQGDVADGVVYTLAEDGASYTVSDIDGFTATEFAIPETYKNMPVAAIADKAFSGCKVIRKLTVPQSVTSIGNGAFKGCKALEEITLPFVGASAEAEGEEALFGYIFGNKAFSNSYKIYQKSGDDEFKAYIPNSLKKVTVTGEAAIKAGAFYACESLTEVSVEKAASIDVEAFDECEALNTVYIASAEIAKAATTDGAIGGLCKHANIIYVEEGITEVGAYITETLDLQDEKTEFAGKRYNRYSAYEENGALYRKSGAGYELMGLVEGYDKDTLKIPSTVKGLNVTTVKKGACLGAKSLKTVYVPATVTEIGDDAFKDCDKLGDVYIASVAIAQETVNNMSFGSVCYYANNIYVDATIENVSQYFTEVFLEFQENAATVDGISYNKYSGTETTTRFEAEYAVLTGKNNEGGTAFVRGNANCSNGQYVGNMNVAGNTIKYVINSSHDVRAKIIVRIASLQHPNGNIATALSNMYSLTVNGIKPLGYDDVIINPSEQAKAPGGSYTDFVDVVFAIDLIKGENEVLFAAGTATNNIDYIELVCMSRLEWTETQNEFKQND